jgi:hypothetical protein
MNDIPDFTRHLEPAEGVKDAIHVPIMPAVADTELQPGQHVGPVYPDHPGIFGVTATPLGIVNPYLTSPVPKGGTFYVFIYPGKIASLHHVWVHPELAKRAAAQQRKFLSHE